jgi:hypothetical protein
VRYQTTIRSYLCWAAALRSSWPFIRGAVGRLIAGAGILKAGAGIWKWWSGG